MSTPPITMRTLEELNRLIVQNLSRIRELEPSVVCHLPRSGSIVGSLIATHLYLPMASVEEVRRGLVWNRKGVTLGNNILLVDDSFHTGIQMKAAIERIREAFTHIPIKTFAVFNSRPTPPKVRLFEPDLTLCDEKVDGRYIYPWFLWKTYHTTSMCFDMDGVLCDDCGAENDDEGERYLQFLYHAKPKFRSMEKLGCIVTSRLERYRAVTEDYLKRNGVEYAELIMGPWRTNAERRASGAANWKAAIYADRPQSTLFVESEGRSSRVIAELTGKRVWCVDEQRWY